LSDEDPNKFIAKMGGDAVRDLLSRIDLKKLSGELRHKASHESSQQRKSEALKRLSVVEAFREANEHVSKTGRNGWWYNTYL
jgi:DNA-directed RNA polymerase subunit beta'